MMLAVPAPGLTEAYPLREDAIDQFRRDGFIHLRRVVAPETLRRYADEITIKVLELTTMDLQLSHRSTYDKAFLQVANSWRQSNIVKELVFSCWHDPAAT